MTTQTTSEASSSVESPDSFSPTSSPAATVVLTGSKRLNPLVERLRSANIKVILGSSIREINHYLNSESVEIVIAAQNKRSLDIINHLRTWTAAPPLLVIVHEGRERCNECASADLVLSLSDPHLIENILRVQKLHKLAQGSSSVTTKSEVELLKNMIVKTVSHELRTPLLQVKSAVALLAEGEQDRERLIGYATESTARLENVVQNITRLAESLDIKLTLVQPAEVINYALRQLRRSWEWREKSDRLVVDASPELLPVIADRQALGVALQLLLDNGLKFSSGQVHVSAFQVAEQAIEFRVSDTGIGIAPELLERIFEPFYQVDHASARRFGGSGVGLAIVRLIMERHGIQIHVSSEQGIGSSFSFVLPTVPSGTLPP